MATLPEPYVPDVMQGIRAHQAGYAFGREQQQNALAQRAGGMAAGGDFGGAANALLQGGDLQGGFSIQDRVRAMAKDADEQSLAKSARANDLFFRLATVADTPEKWNSAIANLRSMGADTAGFEDFGSRDMAMARFGQTKDVLGAVLEERKARAISSALLPQQQAQSAADGRPTVTNAMNGWKQSIAGIESAAEKDPYRALGPTVQSGDRAYGKYQVMGANIAQWTKDALGQSLTPQQFLASPEAQERVFEHRFGGYVQKYGSPEAAASVWFTGRPSAPNAQARNPDGSPLGITGQQYVDQFRSGLRGGSPVSQPNALAPQQGGGRLNYEAGIRAALESGDVATALKLQELNRAPKGSFEFTKYGVGNKDTGELRPYANSTGDPEVTLEKGKFEQSLRKEYTDLSKDFKTLQDATNRIKVGASADSAVGDLSLIYGYMKLLDPGSVVRETEFATAENAQGVPDRIRNTWNRVMEGERLTPQMRQQFVTTAEQLAAQQTQRMQRVRAQFESIARETGAAPGRVMIDEGLSDSTGGPQVGKIEDGYRFKGGNPADRNSWEKVEKVQ